MTELQDNDLQVMTSSVLCVCSGQNNEGAAAPVPLAGRILPAARGGTSKSNRRATMCFCTMTWRGTEPALGLVYTRGL